MSWNLKYNMIYCVIYADAEFVLLKESFINI